MPIQNSRSHKHDRKNPIQTIYQLDDNFFLADDNSLKRIQLNSIWYTNRGEPYKELAKVEYQEIVLDKLGYEQSIDIEFEDAVELIRYCASNGITLKIAQELTNNRRFKQAIADSQESEPTHPVPDPATV